MQYLYDLASFSILNFEIINWSQSNMEKENKSGMFNVKHANFAINHSQNGLVALSANDLTVWFNMMLCWSITNDSQWEITVRITGISWKSFKRIKLEEVKLTDSAIQNCPDDCWVIAWSLQSLSMVI